MGLIESKLYPQTVKSLVRQDSMTPLPSFSMDTAKFSNGSSGFVITSVDIAKNSNVRTVSVKFMYSPAENVLVYVGNDETILTFMKDRLTGKVLCSVSQATDTIIRFCVTTYEPLEDTQIDMIGTLYSKQ
jgi:hypothetical protein